MKYDIVPVNRFYRGIGRTLQATDILTKYTKRIYDDLLNNYYDYLSNIQDIPSKSGMLELMDFYHMLRMYRIECEIIIYDTHPLTNIWDYELEFLGIDIVRDMCESLLSSCKKQNLQQYLNENGLCENLDDINRVIPLLDHGNVSWGPCYVYCIK